MLTYIQLVLRVHDAASMHNYVSDPGQLSVELDPAYW